ncbi:CAP domain-containing protein [Parasedimentitalea marina]|uniref:CAP domain-containing protein n=1 Tax=Parasedimentitalea marina TaxID=2483033 RepID=A0A3T0N4A6_9RHOB|nr:CAP domain-containing protein [Parasedimentitalea marina]AZV78873.1 CAP domain-containing protein [Parasedimentitalea marina]
MKHLGVLAISILIWSLPVATAEVNRSAATSSINALRADKRLPQVQFSKALETVARAHAQDMVRNGFFSHTGSDGSNIGDRLTRSGYGWCGAAENIAKGQPTLADVMTIWATSRGHRKNMLNKNFTRFALVRATGNVWVMVLAQPGC